MATRLDRAEFGRLFERHARLLWVVAAAFVPRASAEDVVQEAAAVALDRLHAFDPTTDFRAWMTQIVRNVANNERRRQRRAPTPEPVSEQVASAHTGNGVGGDGGLHELQVHFDDRVVYALANLRSEARAVLLLRVVLDLDYAEIATTLGLPPGTGKPSQPRTGQPACLALGSGHARAGTLAQLQPTSRFAMTHHEKDDRLDAALRRAFAPPPFGATIAEIQARAARSPAPRVLRRTLLGLAAAAVVAVAWLLSRDDPSPPSRSDDAPLSTLWVAAYHHAIERGFDVPQCCDSACDLRTRCQDLFAARLDVAAATGIDLCGTYCGPAGGAAALLTRAGDDPVCVFVLPRARAPEVEARELGGLHLHRRDVGDLVVFELSRLPEPRVLPQVYVPEG